MTSSGWSRTVGKFQNSRPTELNQNIVFTCRWCSPPFIEIFMCRNIFTFQVASCKLHFALTCAHTVQFNAYDNDELLVVLKLWLYDIPLFCRKPVKLSYYWPEHTELITWACMYSSRLAHHCQIFGRHLLLPVIEPFVVQQPYTLSVISQFSMNVWTLSSWNGHMTLPRLLDWHWSHKAFVPE